MFLAIDHMRTVRVRALSPDKSVTATMTAESGIRVCLELGSLNRHNRQSLTRAVRAAVSGVLEAYRKAGEEIMRRKVGPDAFEDAWNTSAGRRLRPFVEALERLEVRAVGPRGLAKVGMKDGRFRVAFRDAALELRESELGAEIDAALSAMYDRRSEKAVELYEELVATEESEAQ